MSRFCTTAPELSSPAPSNVIPVGDDQPIPYTLTRAATACVDGHTWCAGAPGDHSDPREHIHSGPEHSISGPYGNDLINFNLGKFDPDGRPHICFVGEGDWRELDVPAVDQLLTDVRTWLGDLRAARDELARITAPTVSEPVGARTWTITLAGGGHITGTCPSWCQDEHDAGPVAADKASIELQDLTHYAEIDGAELAVTSPGYANLDGKVTVHDDSVLQAQLTQQPHSDLATDRQPTVSIEIVTDYWLEDLGPDELADVIGKLRTQADRLSGLHAQLVAARAEQLGVQS